mmetsp:Transcript_42777/g.118138  ORF Transcript_42777/g.118138 Transcript_42777/m.118138 type:complete len:347 (-) Transcript_42777:905-1945(-)
MPRREPPLEDSVFEKHQGVFPPDCPAQGADRRRVAHGVRGDHVLGHGTQQGQRGPPLGTFTARADRGVEADDVGRQAVTTQNFQRGVIPTGRRNTSLGQYGLEHDERFSPPVCALASAHDGVDADRVHVSAAGITPHRGHDSDGALPEAALLARAKGHVVRERVHARARFERQVQQHERLLPMLNAPTRRDSGAHADHVRRHSGRHGLAQQLDRHVPLSTRTDNRAITHYIWAEAAGPHRVEQRQRVLPLAGSLASVGRDVEADEIRGDAGPPRELNATERVLPAMAVPERNQQGAIADYVWSYAAAPHAHQSAEARNPLPRAASGVEGRVNADEVWFEAEARHGF